MSHLDPSPYAGPTTPTTSFAPDAAGEGSGNAAEGASVVGTRVGPRRPMAVAFSLVAFTGAVAGFVSIASLTEPRGSMASDVTTPALGDRVYMGELVHRDHRVRIYTTNDAPRYDVLDANGRVEEANLLAEELYHLYPDLDVTRLRLAPSGADQPGALMLADPIRDDIQHR